MVLGKRNRQFNVSQNNDDDMEIVGDDEDRISELSDPLLLHILSFLPTKCVVSTSILSKRWRTVWTSIPVFNFCDWWSQKGTEKTLTRRITRLMDRVLAPWDCMPNIKEIYIDCGENLSISSVNKWIAALLQRKIEKLHLDIGERIGSFMLAPCLFTCESLTMLDLNSENLLQLPESISFPRLKILRLMSIGFVDEKRTQLFFSSCPVLEELTMCYCYWVDMKYVIISAPALKYLVFRFGDPIRGFLADCVVEIKAPNLLSLGYTEHVAKDYVLGNFLSLIDANIDLMQPVPDMYEETSMEEVQSMGYAAKKLVQKLSNVKVLKMSHETFELLSFADDIKTNLPTFHNLIDLEVTSISNGSIIGVFFDFLHVTPNLESIVFAEDPFDSDDKGWTMNVVPQCLLLHLKTVEIHTRRLSNELTWVKLFLKNAAVLQKLTITSKISKIKAETMEEILMFPRASTNCNVKFLSSKNILYI